jgi:hypothetical protein
MELLARFRSSESRASRSGGVQRVSDRHLDPSATPPLNSATPARKSPTPNYIEKPAVAPDVSEILEQLGADPARRPAPTMTIDDERGWRPELLGVSGGTAVVPSTKVKP